MIEAYSDKDSLIANLRAVVADQDKKINRLEMENYIYKDENERLNKNIDILQASIKPKECPYCHGTGTVYSPYIKPYGVAYCSCFEDLHRK